MTITSNFKQPELKLKTEKKKTENSISHLRSFDSDSRSIRESDPYRNIEPKKQLNP